MSSINPLSDDPSGKAGRGITRRQTLGLLAATAAAIPIRSAFGFPADGDTSRRMTLGYSTYPLPQLTAAEAVKLIAQTGYDSVELTVTPDRDVSPDRLSSDRRKTIRQVIEDHGLRLTSLMEHLPIAGEEAEHARQLEQLKKSAALAHDLSPDRPPVIQTVLGGRDWPAARELFLKRLPDWKRIAEETHTIVAIKPHRGNALSRPDDAVALLKELGESPRLRLCYDYSHFAFREMPLEETIATAAPYTAHIAVKDAVRNGDKVDFELPGVGGTIDYAALLKGFHARGYRGDVCVEVSSLIWKRADYDAAKAIHVCYEHLSQAFNKAGLQRG